MRPEQTKRGLAALPLVLTVEEAAELLRIGRSAAYERAAEYERTGGQQGLPVLRFGRSLRVPRHRLEQLLGMAGGDPSHGSEGSP